MKQFLRGVLCAVTLASVVVAQQNEVVTCRAIPFCKTCHFDTPTTAICDQCIRFYAINETTGRCVDCMTLTGCFDCKTTKLCTRCINPRKEGPDFNGLIGTCSSCAENCRDCRKAGSGLCDHPAEGFFINSAKKTSTCQENCMQCREGVIGDLTCVHCKSGFEKIDGKCVACTPNCKICTMNKDGKCARCNFGYELKNEDKTCIKSPILNGADFNNRK